MTSPLTQPLPGDVSTFPGSAVRREVEEVFVRYEEALALNDVATMTELFWDSPFVVRFGVVDSQRGADEIRAWRASQPPLPADRRLSETDILVLNPDTAVVTTKFAYGDAPATGRQTQVWSRTPDGWRVVSAHVSDLAL